MNDDKCSSCCCMEVMILFLICLSALMCLTNKCTWSNVAVLNNELEILPIKPNNALLPLL